MIRLGQLAPDFTATASDGRSLTLSALRGRPVVLFFFPKAFTLGCTREAAQFRDAMPELRGYGAEVIGISEDTHQTNCAFAESLALGYPLIGDADGKIARSYDVLWAFIKIAKRMTFVIDAEGVLRFIFSHEVLIARHGADVLGALKKLAAEPRLVPTTG